MGYFEFLDGSRIICLFWKIALRASLRKANGGRGLDSSPSSLLYDAISTHPEEQHLSSKQTGTTTIFSLGYESCTWARSDLFCWENPCSGSRCGIDLVVVLEYTFFQLCFNKVHILRFTRFRRRYVNPFAVVLTYHCQSYTAFLFHVRCSMWPQVLRNPHSPPSPPPSTPTLRKKNQDLNF